MEALLEPGRYRRSAVGAQVIRKMNILVSGIFRQEVL